MRSKLSVAALTGAAALLLTATAPSSAASREAAQNLGDPDYGVCRGTDPRCYHDWGNFDPAKGYRLLVYSRTAGPRHAHLGTPLGPGLNPPLNDDNVAIKAVLKLGQDNGFAVDYTEDVAQLSSAGRLLPYNAVMFLSTTRDALDDAAQTALRQYIRAGGGFVGVHNAFGTEYNWPWYEGLLGNANFYDHAANQPAPSSPPTGATPPPRGCRSAGPSATSGTTSSRSPRASASWPRWTRARWPAACAATSATPDTAATIRSAGASTTTAAGPGSRPSATTSRRGPTSRWTATSTSSSTCSAA